MKGLYIYIKKALIFLLILIGINEIGRQYFYRISVRNHKLTQTDQVFYDSTASEIPTLILGHSRPYLGIDDHISTGISQFCSPGETSVQTYFKLKYLLEHTDKELKRVILPFGFGTFCHSKPDVMTNSWYWNKYIDYNELGEVSGNYWAYFSVNIRSKITPYYEYPSLRLKYFFEELNPSLQSISLSEMNIAERRIFSSTIVEHQNKTRDLYSETSLHYLKETISLAKKYELELIYVKYPISSYYREALSKFEEDKKWNISSFERELQINKIKTINFESIFDDQVSFFKDPQHLNKNGRAHFTKVIRQKLNL